jgi:hypothetical protein
LKILYEIRKIGAKVNSDFLFLYLIFWGQKNFLERQKNASKPKRRRRRTRTRRERETASRR